MKLNKISDAEFIEKFNELSYRELATHFGISIPTVQKYVKRLHIPKRETIDKIDKERLTELLNHGHSYSKIGRELGVCGTTIIRIARKMGLKERTLKKSSKKVSVASEPNPVLHQLDQKIIYPHYDFKHLTESILKSE